MKARLGELCGTSSAGARLAGFIRLLALRVLQEIGIDHAASSKGIDGFRHMAFDLVVTVWDSALEERPVWPGSGNRVHLGSPNPAEATGSEVEVIPARRQGRDRIEHLVPPGLSSSLGFMEHARPGIQLGEHPPLRRGCRGLARKSRGVRRAGVGWSLASTACWAALMACSPRAPSSTDPRSSNSPAPQGKLRGGAIARTVPGAL